MSSEKVRENRVRRMAHRQGLCLMRSRARDPLSLTFGGYQLISLRNGEIVLGHRGWRPAMSDEPEAWHRGYAATLDQVEAWLKSEKK
ncbi:MAG TPA: hypothetical protein VMV27_07870 [Candidatus Binataceae bacterium]|nr:hypothetical protein [Candidatus Binataceae bacterium]